MFMLENSKYKNEPWHHLQTNSVQIIDIPVLVQIQVHVVLFILKSF